MAAPRRRLNPKFRRSLATQDTPQSHLAFAAGWPYYTNYFVTVHARRVAATPLVVQRLERLADLVAFPRGEIFLDEVGR
jgi:hypothetical protein